MIDWSDPLERLRAANPVPSSLATATMPDPVLLRRIVEGDPVVDTARLAPRRAAPRRARRLVPALVLTTLLGGAGAYALFRGEVTKPQTVACYEEADLEAPAAVVGVGKAGPLAACAELWRRGALGTGTVPDLVECVLDTGVVGVFPAALGADVCALLGLAATASTAPPTTGPVQSSTAASSTAPPAAPSGDVNARFLAFRDAVVRQFLDVGCMNPQVGAEIVRRELDAAELRDWTARSTGFSADRPCATLDFRPEAREVILVGAPPRR